MAASMSEALLGGIEQRPTKCQKSEHADDTVKSKLSRDLPQTKDCNTYRHEPQTNDDCADWKWQLLNTKSRLHPELGYNPLVLRPPSLAHYNLEGKCCPIPDADMDEASPASFSPCFIAGMMRGGTTYVTSALTHHPDLYCFSEARILPLRVFPELDFYCKQQVDGNLYSILEKDAIDAARAQRLRQLYYKAYRTVDEKLGRGALMLDKNPDWNIWMDVLDAAFPTSKVIDIIREPRKCVRSMVSYRLSWDRQENGLVGYNHGGIQAIAKYLKKHPQLMGELGITAEALHPDVEDCEKMYTWYAFSALMMDKWASRQPPGRYLKLAYEDFTSKPDAAFTTLLNFLGLPVTDEFLRKAKDLLATEDSRGTSGLLDSRFFDHKMLNELYQKHLTTVAVN
eukprot:TRINITY_DN7685_c0_g1_i1.p1 TRINITY_DN7685_c0_g1~~TRINITY_DN7685_c0_g1_i1.p1  ORF type:complete len:397 (+),score=64.09 TRINITY_DN7685_c0_g1_i1:72-1262(+)